MFLLKVDLDFDNQPSTDLYEHTCGGLTPTSSLDKKMKSSFKIISCLSSLIFILLLLLIISMLNLSCSDIVQMPFTVIGRGGDCISADLEPFFSFFFSICLPNGHDHSPKKYIIRVFLLKVSRRCSWSKNPWNWWAGKGPSVNTQTPHHNISHTYVLKNKLCYLKLRIYFLWPYKWR